MHLREVKNDRIRESIKASGREEEPDRAVSELQNG